MKQLFAVALNDQGRFAQTRISEFVYSDETGMHVYRGKLAESMDELADQVNAAMKAIEDFGNIYLRLRVVKIQEKTETTVAPETSEYDVTPESVKSALLTANAELQRTVSQMPMPARPTLELVNT